MLLQSLVSTELTIEEKLIKKQKRTCMYSLPCQWGPDALWNGALIAPSCNRMIMAIAMSKML